MNCPETTTYYNPELGNYRHIFRWLKHIGNGQIDLYTPPPARSRHLFIVRCLRGTSATISVHQWVWWLLGFSFDLVMSQNDWLLPGLTVHNPLILVLCHLTMQYDAIGMNKCLDCFTDPIFFSSCEAVVDIDESKPRPPKAAGVWKIIQPLQFRFANGFLFFLLSNKPRMEVYNWCALVTGKDCLF